MAYDKKKSVEKAKIGSVEGVVAGLVATAVIGWLKQTMDMSPGLENSISLVAGAVVSAISVAATRYLQNWNKHRKDA